MTRYLVTDDDLQEYRFDMSFDGVWERQEELSIPDDIILVTRDFLINLIGDSSDGFIHGVDAEAYVDSRITKGGINE